MRSTADAKKFSSIAADTTYFPLDGGRYQVAVVATWNSSGTVTFEQRGPDGSTALVLGTAFSANGVANFDVPPGQYKLVVATATAVSATVVRVPVGE